MRASLCLLCLGLLACGPELAVVPPAGAPHVTGSTQGAIMTAFADQWAADPSDLADYVTPIAVDIYNGTSQELRVSLSDFSLRTDTGVRLAALNPFGNPLSQNEPAHGPLVASLSGQEGVVVAVNVPPPSHSMGTRGPSMGPPRGGFVGPPPSRGWVASPGYGPRRSWGSYGTGYGRSWGRGFYISPGLRGWYGPGALYWGSPWAYPLGYSTWVWAWPSVGVSASRDVITLALPEGVLAPGSHVNGFIYFQRVGPSQAHNLDLSWTPTDARTGAAVGEAKVSLEVVHLR